MLLTAMTADSSMLTSDSPSTNPSQEPNHYGGEQNAV
ncbi:hypothetical protein ES703_27831 [subsurface metagenome]